MYHILFSACCFANADAAQVVNVEYIHNAIREKHNVSVPYSAQLQSPSVVANMKYLLTAVDVANQMLNGAAISNYGSSDYATTAAADTIATDTAIETLIKQYTSIQISLDADDGNGVYTQITCSGAGCTLPVPSVTKTNTAFTGKWCTQTGGAGTCWDAGTQYKYEDFESDTTLYAGWASVYKIAVIRTSGEFANAPVTSPDEFYLQYGIRWCADAHCKTPITKLNNVPVFPGYKFNGVKTNAMSWLGVKSNWIIDENGEFIMDSNALTTAAREASAQSYWGRDTTYCGPGSYYVGHETRYNNIYCQTCPVGNYCTGGYFTTTYQDYSTASGLSTCPDGTTTTISGATSVSDCVAQ